MRGLEVVGKLALYLLAARILGPHEAGLFFLCITWAHLLSTAARLGLDRAVMRHLAADLAVEDRPAARGSLRQGVMLTVPAALLAGGLTWVLAAPLAIHVFAMPDLAVALALTALLVVPQTVAFFLCAALVGLGRSVVAQALQFSVWPLFGVAALLLGVETAAPLLLALVTGMAAVLLAAALLLFDARHRLRGAPPSASGAAPLPSLWRTARPLLVVETIQVAIANLPVLVLGTVAEAAVVGAFSLAMRISMIGWMVVISLGTIAAPHFARLHRRGDWAALGRLNGRLMLAGAATGGTAALVALAAPGPILGLFGPEFRTAGTVLTILAAGQLINAVFCCQDVLLAMTGHGRLLSRLNMLQFLLGLVLMLILVPWHGAEGAAVAVAAVTAIGALGTSAAVRVMMPPVALPGAPPLPGRASRFLGPQAPGDPAR